MNTPIYLDYNATTPVDPAVLDAMLPFFTKEFGNAASIHAVGQKSRSAVETAREQVAALINARPQEIIFTSGVPNPTTTPSSACPTPPITPIRI